MFLASRLKVGTYVYFWKIKTKIKSKSKHLNYVILGRNTCPDEFPYSYNYGGNCCISPFKSPESSRALLTPSDTNTDITIGDCLGASIECQLTGNRACRTNLKYISTSPFKALTDKKWNYNYKLCTEHCNTVYMKANLA